jgi:hypothetical protein
VRYALPAVNLLAEEIDLHLVCPDFLALKLAGLNKRVTLTVTPRLDDYNKYIKLCLEYSPDVVLHLNAESPNNKYKTVHALLNGSLLGAALIASNDEPYTGLPENVVTLVNHDSEEILNALRRLLLSDAERERQIARARQYCREAFGSRANSRLIDMLSLKHPAPDAYEMKKRMHLCLQNARIDFNRTTWTALREIRENLIYISAKIRQKGLLKAMIIMLSKFLEAAGSSRIFQCVRRACGQKRSHSPASSGNRGALD